MTNREPDAWQTGIGTASGYWLEACFPGRRSSVSRDLGRRCDVRSGSSALGGGVEERPWRQRIANDDDGKPRRGRGKLVGQSAQRHPTASDHDDCDALALLSASLYR